MAQAGELLLGLSGCWTSRSSDAALAAEPRVEGALLQIVGTKGEDDLAIARGALSSAQD